MNYLIILANGQQARILEGKDTQQLCGVTGCPAVPEEWYWEPASYEGDSLWSCGFETRQEAEQAAAKDHVGDVGKLIQELEPNFPIY